MSDPICEQSINETLRNDECLRALCLSGSLPLQAYVNTIAEAGFGTLEVRARRPYRVLAPGHYLTEELIFIESVEVCAIKDPTPSPMVPVCSQEKQLSTMVQSLISMTKKGTS